MSLAGGPLVLEPAIRPARPSDADPLAALVTSLAGHFGDEDLAEPWTGEGLSPFEQSITPEGFRQRLADSEYRYWVVPNLPVDTDGPELLGTIALRRSEEARRAHLYHLFVALDAQKTGLGRRLVDHGLAVLRSEGIEHLTVNSSPGAIGFYERLGFEATAELTRKNGIAALPMARGL